MNKHIDYTKLAGSTGFDSTAKSHSLATPLDMAVTSDGKTLYVAAFGSSKIGVFDTVALEQNTFDPVTASQNYIAVSGGGVSGLALDEARGRIYATTRFDDAVKVIDLKSHAELAQLPLPNPEPPSVLQGRIMLYDATTFFGQRRSRLRQLPYFRRYGRPGLGSRQPRRRGHQEHYPHQSRRTARLSHRQQ